MSTSAEKENKLPKDSLEALRTQFERDGFIVIEGFWSKETCSKLRQEIDRIIRGFNLEEVRTIFSTNDQKRTSDEYFMASGDKIRFFWEVRQADADLRPMNDADL